MLGRRGVVVGLVGLCALAVGAAPSQAQSVDQTCQLELVKVDPTFINVAYPDEGASYWVAAYQNVPGTRLRITGRYPHARYMSFGVYDAATRPIDGLADIDTEPDPGHTNPFFVGADRTAENRSYTAFVDFGPLPANGERARNTLYTGSGQKVGPQTLPNANGTLIYRIYAADEGRGESGGVRLPRLTLETLEGGEPPPSLCDDFTRPELPNANDDLAAMSGVPAPEPGEWPGRTPPRWRKTSNLLSSYGSILLSNPYGDPAYQVYEGTGVDKTVGGKGALFANLHNSYMAALTNRGYGQVLVFRMRAPGFADTRAGAAVMPAADLRYFSVCQNDVLSTRYIACRTDDRTTVAPDGFMTFAISTQEQRPENATSACGVNWIPWGPVRSGVVLYRHMLPAPDFAQAIQRIPEQGKELETLGDYHPAARYFADRAAFERLGCEGAAKPPGLMYGAGAPAP